MGFCCCCWVVWGGGGGGDFSFLLVGWVGVFFGGGEWFVLFLFLLLFVHLLACFYLSLCLMACT